jgi:transposase InsO family protein
VQYASGDYTEILEQGEIQISMSRRGNPYDNARAERFMRTLKEEEVYGTDYRDLKDARSRIGEFLEKVYNTQPYVRLSRIRLPPRVFDDEALIRPRMLDARLGEPLGD